MDKSKISAGVWTLGMGTDRYVGRGYRPFIDFRERVDRISHIPGISAVEATFPNDINEDGAARTREMLSSKGLTLAALGVELVCDEEWRKGSFTSPDAERREKSIELTCRAMDVAQSLGADVVSLWLGQDGFDYVFEADYPRAWGHLIESLRTCAEHRSDIKLAIEYKTSEPKMSCYVNSGGKALALALATGMKNVGVTLDVGHAFNARENPAEVAAVLLSERRLFHLHLNDNYGYADDDMPPGSVHWPQYIELFYWLKKMAYQGWFSLDLYPYRDDPVEACTVSLMFMKRIMAVVSAKDFEPSLKRLSAQPISRILGWLEDSALLAREAP